MGRLSVPQKQEQDKIVEWVKKFKAEKDDEAFEEIAKALHTYLQHLSIKKFRIAGTDSSDVYQEGLFALSTKAIPDYKEEKGAFLSFAKLCIRRHIITFLKSSHNNKNKALNKSVSLDAASSDDDEDTRGSVSWHPDTGEESVSDSFSRAEFFARQKASLEGKLTPLEKCVLECYLQNMSYLDIVKAMNKQRRGKNRVKPKVIDNALCRIKKKALEIEEELQRRRGRSGDGNDADSEDG